MDMAMGGTGGEARRRDPHSRGQQGFNSCHCESGPCITACTLLPRQDKSSQHASYRVQGLSGLTVRSSMDVR